MRRLAAAYAACIRQMVIIVSIVVLASMVMRASMIVAHAIAMHRAQIALPAHRVMV